MAGIHKFTSSLWVQSGSQAVFKNGMVVSESLTVDGTVTATTFEGDGSKLTGLVTAEFHAGTGSAISASAPSSEDHFIELATGQSNAPEGSIHIQTTHSVGFSPNHYTFVKITDTFETLQSGSSSTYIGTDRTPEVDVNGQFPHTNDLAPGVHRYFIYAADTGSNGETHFVYSTAFIKSFINVQPTIIIPTGSGEEPNSAFTTSIAHDADTHQVTTFFTRSFDSNDGDFIRVFSASRFTIDPQSANSGRASYELTMQHHQSNVSQQIFDQDDNEDIPLITTGTVDPVTLTFGDNATALPNNVLAFTSSISNYSLVDGTTVYAGNSQTQEERFKIRVLDNNPFNNETVADFTMSIVAPPTTSIRNIRVELESGSFSDTPVTEFRTKILYDDTATRTSTGSLHNRYTSSLVRLSVLADITEPIGYEAADDHLTTIRIQSSSDEFIHNNDKTFKYFRFRGNQTTASNYGSNIAHTTVYTDKTGSNGYTPFSFEPQSVYFGAADNVLDSTHFIRHGSNNHFKADNTGTSAYLIIDSVENIEISNVAVEVESGSYLANTGLTERTASILYGYNQTFLTSETSSLEGYTKSAEYISESVIRLRVRAKITEPFGPHHTDMAVTLASTNVIVDGHTHDFQFYTGSGVVNCIDSSSTYDTRDRLVSHYTSSWKEFKFDPGVYVFSASFTNTTNAGRSISGIPLSSSISVSNTAQTIIENINYQTEDAGHSYIATNETTRSVLYGIPHHTIDSTASFDYHPTRSFYASHSLTQFRVLAKITEPFGPHHTASRFEKRFRNIDGIYQPTSSFIRFSTASAHVFLSSSVRDDQHRLVSHYTSSWIGQVLSSSNHTDGVKWSYESGSIIHRPHDNSGVSLTPVISSSLRIFDTKPTHFTDFSIETETYGYSLSPTTSSIRTVLYGDSHITRTNSSSFENHISASAYASQSISRFRMIVKVIEPPGPLTHTSSRIEKAFQYTDSIDDTKTETITFSSGSTIGLFASQSFFDESKRYVSIYTSSFIGKALEATEGADLERPWEVTTGSIFHAPPGENGISASHATTSIVVKDTSKTQIDKIYYEIEEFGYSNSATSSTMRTVLYGDAHTTLATTESVDWESHTSASTYASHSISRFRIRARITEPVGTLHTASLFEKVWTQGPVTETVTILDSGSWDTATVSGFGSAGVSTTGTAAKAVDYLISNVDALTPNINTYYLFSKNWNAGDSATFQAQFPSARRIVQIRMQSQYGLLPDNITVQGSNDGGTFTDIHTTGITATSDTGDINFQTQPNVNDYLFYRIVANNWDGTNVLYSHIDFYELISTPRQPITSHVIFSTSSADVANSASGYDTSNRLVTDYTASFIGQALPSTDFTVGESWSYISGSILHEPEGENKFVTASGQTASIVVFDTAPTIIQNYRIETETFGESGVGIQNTIEANSGNISRSILYGDSATRSNTSSMETHPGIYSASAVTKFRILADIIEPLGPLHHSSSIRYAKQNFGRNTSAELGNLITFSTSSNTIIVSSSAYDVQNRLVGSYTSSFLRESISSSFPGDTETYWRFRVDGDDTTHILHNAAGENSHNATTDSDLYFTVSASQDVSMSNLSVEVESFPYSSSIGAISRTETILYGHTSSLQDIEADTIGNIWSGSAAIRLRILGTITEPIGFGHFKTQVSMSDGSGHIHAFKFHTASLNTSSRSDRILNSDNKFVTSYTSSWYGSREFTAGNYTFTPNANTGSNTVGTYISTDGINIDPVDTATLAMQPPEPTEITNISVQVEHSYSGSNIGTSSRETIILHGNTITETDHVVNLGYPNNSSSNQLTSIRVLTDIQEPFGPHHTASKFTISGYDTSHIFTLHTSSVDVTHSIDKLYDTNSSQSVAYTSSWHPISMSNAGTTDLIFIIKASNVQHLTGNHTASGAAYYAISSSITVKPANTASVFVTPAISLSDTDWSSSSDISTYITYNSENTNIFGSIVSGISSSAPTIRSASNLDFPTHLNLLYQDGTDPNSTISWYLTNDSTYKAANDFNASSTGEESMSLRIYGQDIENSTNLEQFTVFISGSNILPGNGLSSNESLSFAVVPARPQSMQDVYWNTVGPATHDTTAVSYLGVGINIPSVSSNTRRLYKGALPTGLGVYGPDDSPGDTKSNIMMAKDSALGPVNYTMSFTPFSPSNTGGYGDDDRLFNFGDSGSLIVKINGTVAVSASLQKSFDVQSKSGSQILSSYNGYGFTAGTASFIEPFTGSGKLILTHIEPFNNISQSLTNGSIFYPNGYQGWSARIELDNKLFDGYNKLEFSHSIDGETTQSWQPFEWYYDDGILTASLDTRNIVSWSYQPVGDITQSYLSGVSFFKKSSNRSNNHIVLSLQDRIKSIANKTYRDPVGSNQSVVITTRGSEYTSINKIEIDSGSVTNGVTTLNHDLTSVATREGLTFTSSLVDYYSLIPVSQSTASINKIISYVDSTLPTNPSDYKGTVYTIDIEPQVRNFNGIDNWIDSSEITSIPVGRFLKNPSVTANSSQFEDFRSENFRWASQSIHDSQSFNFNSGGSNYGLSTGAGSTSAGRPGYEDFWINGRLYNDYTDSTDYQIKGPDFDSIANISQSADLQTIYAGRLVYPTIDYSSYSGITHPVVHPSLNDYSNASGSGDRYFIRAMKVTGINSGANFKIDIDASNIVLSDIFANAAAAENFNSKNIRIDVKIPGPIGSATSNANTTPGTGWGVITGGTGLGSTKTNDFWAANQSPPIVSNGIYTFSFSFGTFDTNQAYGVMLFRIRYKSEATGSDIYIKDIDLYT